MPIAACSRMFRFRVRTWPLVVLLSCFILTPAVRSEIEGEPLPRFTLEECLDIGIREASARKEARLDEAISETLIGQIRAQVLPNLRLSGAYTRLDERIRFEMPEGAFTLGQLNNYTLNAEVTQLLYAGGSVRSALGAAHHYRAVSQAAVRQVEQGLRLYIRTGFYNLLLARRNVEVREASLAQVRAMAEEAERHFRAGTGSDFDRLAAQVRLANEQPLLRAARHEYHLARAAFRELVRLPVDDFEPDGTLAWTPVRASEERLREIAWGNRPEVEIAEKRLALLRADIRVEQGNYLPSVQARASYGGSNPASFTSMESEWEWGWEAGVVAQWPLFDGALTRHRVREKRGELEKGLLARDDLRRAIDLEIEQALLRVNYAEEAAEASRETVSLAERGLAIARTRFEIGLATRLEYTDAQLALNTARLAQAQALRDYQAAVAQLTHAAGLETLDVITGETP